MNFLDALNRRYDVVISATTDKDFYLNCYYYFDYIHRNPELNKIFEDAYMIYTKKFFDIWADYNEKRRIYLDSGRSIEPPKITTEPFEVSRLEKFDMYCNACGLDARVYHPIKHYQECDCPELCGDFVGSLLVKGLEYTLKRYKDDYREFKGQIIQRQKNFYKDERENYQTELSRFHIEFTYRVAQLSELNVPETMEIKPFLNFSTGDFFYCGTKGNLPPSGQGFKVLRTLLEAKDYKASHDQLVKSYLPNIYKATKVQKSGLHTIIRNIKKQIGVLPKGEWGYVRYKVKSCVLNYDTDTREITDVSPFPLLQYKH